MIVQFFPHQNGICREEILQINSSNFMIYCQLGSTLYKSCWITNQANHPIQPGILVGR